MQDPSSGVPLGSDKREDIYLGFVVQWLCTTIPVIDSGFDL